MAKEEEKMRFKVIVLGEPSVGKTCLTYRFCENDFLKSVCATIGVDFREKTVKVDGNNVLIQIWDTAGQERFRHGITGHYFRNADAVMFVYDITNHNTLLKLRNWIEECSEHGLNPDTVPCVIVGNKCDEKDNRQVSMNSAITFADAHRMPVFETSAKDDDEYNNTNSIFETLAYKLVNERKKGVRAENGFKLDSDSQVKEKDESSCWC